MYIYLAVFTLQDGTVFTSRPLTQSAWKCMKECMKCMKECMKCMKECLKCMKERYFHLIGLRTDVCIHIYIYTYAHDRIVYLYIFTMYIHTYKQTYIWSILNNL